MVRAKVAGFSTGFSTELSKKVVGHQLSAFSEKVKEA